MRGRSRRLGGLRYIDAGGSGPALLFLHGAGCEALDWEGVLRLLPAGWRCAALDFRGHGESAVPADPFTLGCLAEDALGLAAALGMESFAAVGHSLGGMVAMEAARRSERVCGLALLEGWTRLSCGAAAFEGGRFYGSLPPSAVERIRQKSASIRARFSDEVWRPFWDSVSAFDGFSFLERAAFPIFAVYGGMGRNARTQARLRVPPNRNIRWVWIDGAGHYLPHECPAEVAAVVERLRRAAFG